MKIFDQREIQHVCGMILNYRKHYHIYQVNVDILFCLIIKKKSISLKSSKFDRRKIKKCLELLSETVNDVWKTTTNFSLNIP